MSSGQHSGVVQMKKALSNITLVKDDSHQVTRHKKTVIDKYIFYTTHKII